MSFYINFYRLQSGQSYFDTLPPHVADYYVTYSKACKCTTAGRNRAQECENVFDVAFPTVLKTNLSPMFLCDRQKRDVYNSDDIQEEDFQLFKHTPTLRARLKRNVALRKLSKENATRHCAERISETEIGKLCAKVGADLQALVNTCSIDLEVSNILPLYKLV